eukprot:767141-Hanusia_phi.AAC.12
MLGGLRSCLGVALMLDLCLGFSLRPLMLHRSSQRESSFVRGTGGPRSLTCQASQSATKSTQVWNGVGELADRYDAFLIDQWGVMHDGKTAYVCPAVRLGKKIILLSNSSRRKGNSLKKIDGMLSVHLAFTITSYPGMGFHSTSILDLITSGEVGWQCLSERPGSLEYSGSAPDISLQLAHLLKVWGASALDDFSVGNGEEDDEYVKSAGSNRLQGVEAGETTVFQAWSSRTLRKPTSYWLEDSLPWSVLVRANRVSLTPNSKEAQMYCTEKAPRNMK